MFELPENPRGSLGVFAVTVPTGTVQVDADTFTDCVGLAQVPLPATIAVIEAGGIAPITRRGTMTRDDEEEEDGDEGEEYGAFSGCSSLREVSLPPNLTRIGEGAFADCTSLAGITLPPNLTENGAAAFDECESLSEIALPPNLTEIRLRAYFQSPVHVLEKDHAVARSHRDWSLCLLTLHILE